MGVIGDMKREMGYKRKHDNPNSATCIRSKHKKNHNLHKLDACTYYTKVLHAVHILCIQMNKHFLARLQYKEHEHMDTWIHLPPVVYRNMYIYNGETDGVMRRKCT